MITDVDWIKRENTKAYSDILHYPTNHVEELTKSTKISVMKDNHQETLNYLRHLRQAILVDELH